MDEVLVSSAPGRRRARNDKIRSKVALFAFSVVLSYAALQATVVLVFSPTVFASDGRRR